MTIEKLTAEILERSKSLGLDCDQVRAEELALLIQEAYEDGAQDLAVEILMNSMQEIRESMK
jgi:hypothetical protein